jgi:hypothetical protein
MLNRLGRPIRCPITLRYSAEEFGLILAKAKAGAYDPFGSIWIRKQRPLFPRIYGNIFGPIDLFHF